MKNNLKYIMLSLFGFTMLFSCIDDDNDELSKDAIENNAIVDVRTTSVGKLLGAPASLDLDNATVVFSDNLLDLEIFLRSGGEQVSEYQITKSLNGGNEVVVATSATLPIGLQYSTLNEFIDGLGVTESELRIGDQIIFRTKFIHSDGASYYSSDTSGTYKVTINCSSNLAGNYGWGTYQPSLDLVEVAAGKYRMPYVASFSGIYWFEFLDVCGELTITDWQYAGGNPITQNEPGYVDSATGDIVFPSIDVAGVSWYVGLEMRYYKN